MFSKSVSSYWKLIWGVKNLPVLRLRKLHILINWEDLTLVGIYSEKKQTFETDLLKQIRFKKVDDDDDDDDELFLWYGWPT